ncbi:MAG: hypothetical protein PSW75_06875 [bacterium]|nr:hypothetical protein [bacterium]MDI1335196.1 hypothetical protein [Lacunisphaera sp.]
MNPDTLPKVRESERTEEKKFSSPLNFTPEQARREAGKLHRLRDDLKSRQAMHDTAMRSSPLGRDD